MTTSAIASPSSNWTSFTDARMVVVLSVKISTFTDLGKLDTKSGNKLRILSVVSITLTPGWRCTLIIMAC